MLTVLRHLLAVAVLPLTVTVIVPRWIANQYNVDLRLPTGPLEIVSVLVGLVVLAIGLVLFGASLERFVHEGQGTLAPWDPPRRLVVRGPYRYVRNPMISGVLFILFGEALILRSGPHLVWALVFLVINAIYIPLVEEHGLEHRFGEDYRQYRQRVRRFLPRLKPWSFDKSKA